jgi:hypothetical protein
MVSRVLMDVIDKDKTALLVLMRVGRWHHLMVVSLKLPCCEVGKRSPRELAERQSNYYFRGSPTKENQKS